MRLLPAAAFLAAMAAPAAASAHHAFAAEYDPCGAFSFKGKVSAVEYINPHAAIHVTGEGLDGKPRTYVFQAGTANTLLRVGLDRQTLKVGMAVTAYGYLEKGGSRCWQSLVTRLTTCSAGGALLTLANGQTRWLGSSGTGAPLLPATWPKPQGPTGGGFRPLTGGEPAKCESSAP